MEKLIEQLMLAITESIKTNTKFDKITLLDILNKSDVDNTHKLNILKVIETNDNLTVLSRKLFNIGDNYEQEQKHAKSLRKYKNTEDNAQLIKDFEQYERYVYSLISTKNYKSRVSQTGEKVRLLDIHTIFGHDPAEQLKDLIQEGKFYLWEGLKKYGVLPEKSKNFGGRMDKGHERKTSSKSTFVHTNIKNNLINLGSRASSDKFKHIAIEFKPEILEGKSED